jgi:hypothetical protein
VLEKCSAFDEKFNNFGYYRQNLRDFDTNPPKIGILNPEAESRIKMTGVDIETTKGNSNRAESYL